MSILRKFSNGQYQNHGPDNSSYINMQKTKNFITRYGFLDDTYVTVFTFLTLSSMSTSNLQLFKKQFIFVFGNLSYLEFRIRFVNYAGRKVGFRSKLVKMSILWKKSSIFILGKHFRQCWMWIKMSDWNKIIEFVDNGWKWSKISVKG